MTAVRTAPSTLEACDFCRATIGEEHQHLFEPRSRKLECACDACAVLFGSEGQTRRKRVPRGGRYLPDFQMSDREWTALMIPINLAFLFHSSVSGSVVAMYPSPGGAIESTPSSDCWREISRRNPVLASMQPDVETLLCYRMDGKRDYFLLPIDECFRLVGLVRTRWKGFSGGTDLWAHVDEFLNRLKR